MSGAAKSLFIYGMYALALSLVLIVAPNVLLNLFGLPNTNEVWIRVAGVLLLYLGFYDTQAARAELTQFLKWSVYTRGTVSVLFAAFVLLGFVKPSLMVFGGIDLLAAIWTGLALRSPDPSPSTLT